jgi:hypothetical protein
MNIGMDRLSFTVPVTSGNYAPEKLDLGGRAVLELSLLIEALPAGAALEVWFLRVSGDPTNAAHYVLGKSFNATGLQDMIPLASWPGVELRVKSGGASGTATVSVGWR